MYHTIPTSGGGSSGTNYDETNFGYDSMKRRNRVVSPGGTIRYTVFDVRGLPESVYVGTDDSGASEEDPTGGGANPNNNMVAVTTTDYDETGEVESIIDPAGTGTCFEYDDAGRTTKLIENYLDVPESESSSSSSSTDEERPSSADENRTTQRTYTADGNVATLVAWNAETGDQTTTYVYGTALSNSEVATSHLLRAIEYPDKQNAGDRVEYSYNRQTQRIMLEDQRHTVHRYDYDKLGRATQDRVTILDAGVDGAVRRIGVELRGVSPSR